MGGRVHPIATVGGGYIGQQSGSIDVGSPSRAAPRTERSAASGH
jgi:hypothetical protein